MMSLTPASALEGVKKNQDYVLAFAFSTDGQQFALIRKNRPAFQAGRLNGVGGKVEAGEDALTAINREFLEETGFDITAHGDLAFRAFHSFPFLGGIITCFCTVLPDLSVLKCPESEVIEVHTLDSISTDKLMDNVEEMVRQAKAFLGF